MDTILKNKNIIIVCVIVLLLGFYFYSLGRNKDSLNLENTATTTGYNASTTVVDLGNGLVAVGKGDFKVEKINGGELINSNDSLPKPIPDLNRKTIFSKDINVETKNAIETKIKEVIDLLNKDKSNLQAWVDLSLYHKMAGDYNGAIIYLNYAGKLYPTNFISFGNLGDIYGFYIKDVGLSEMNYNIAIKNGPKQEYLYYQLASVFRDVSNDKDKARETIERGLKVLPESKFLKEFLDTIK